MVCQSRRSDLLRHKLTRRPQERRPTSVEPPRRLTSHRPGRSAVTSGEHRLAMRHDERNREPDLQPDDRDGPHIRSSSRIAAGAVASLAFRLVSRHAFARRSMRSCRRPVPRGGEAVPRRGAGLQRGPSAGVLDVAGVDSSSTAATLRRAPTSIRTGDRPSRFVKLNSQTPRQGIRRRR